jgi:serine/threonine-protein kinase
MALIVAVVMALTATVINQRQYAAMISQATDYGASLARFIAAQNAVSALSEDWVAVEVAIQEIMKAKDFQGVSVIDREGVVRATSGDNVGQAWHAPASESLGERKGGVAVTRFSADGESVLGFEAPITFQGKRVGTVALGVPERPLLGVARLSIALMVALVVVTVLAVAVAMYFVVNWFAQPIKLLGESMQEIAKGRFDHRIAEQRKDEFGLLYVGFDQMAQALSDRQAGGLDGGSISPPALTIGPSRFPADTGVMREGGSADAS